MSEFNYLQHPPDNRKEFERIFEDIFKSIITKVDTNDTLEATEQKQPLVTNPSKE